MNFRNPKKTPFLLPAALLFCLVPRPSASGATINWNSPDGNWTGSDASVWSPSTAVPGTSDDVWISNGGIARVTENVASKSVILGRTGTLDNRLTIASGVTLTNTANGQLGQAAGSFGTATVDGTWALGAGALYVGALGTGSLTISSGGKVTSASGSLGQNTGGSGTANIAGNWTTTGGVVVGSVGTGSMTIATGGSVTSVGATVGNSGTGTAIVSGTWTYTGANLTVGASSGGNGTLTIQNGGKVTGGNIANVGNAGSQGAITIKSGGLLESTAGGFSVGNGAAGTGTVTVEAGGKMATAGGNIGWVAGSVGTVNVSGTWANSGTVFVGARSSGETGTGTLVVENGGTVTNTAAYIGGGNGGTAGIGGGSVTVKNNGLWQNTSLQVGVYTTGTLTVAAGGTVTSTVGTVGVSAGSNGFASVAGLWDLTGNDLTVGSQGTGSLAIETSGTVKSNIGYIGRNAGGVGSVVVGNNALWENSGTVRVGLSGTGSLLIESGGTVNSVGIADIGWASTTGLGAATVRGTWTIAAGDLGGDLNVGYSGEGSLTIGATGLVDVNSGAGTVYLARANNAAKGTLNIGAAVIDGTPGAAEAPGVLNALVVDGRAAAAVTPLLNFNHTGTNYVFANSASQGIVIQNKVKVNVYAGTTVLTAASTYTGGTEVFGGTLVVDNASGSGTGSGAVLVRGGATVRGTGNIAGGIVLDSSATLGAGDGSTGTLSAGSLLWNGGGLISLRLGSSQPGSDFLSLGGLFQKGSAGSYTFGFSDGTGAPTLNTTYSLIGFGSQDAAWQVADFHFSYTGALPSLDGYFSFNGASETLDFTVTSLVPEPSVYALFGAAFALLYFKKRGVVRA